MSDIAIILIAGVLLIAICEYQRQKWERENPDQIVDLRPMARKNRS